MMGTLAMEQPPTYKAIAPPDAAITGHILRVRGQKVMLDRDLSELYGVQVKVLKQAVRRNMERFPEDFLFELDLEEAEASRSRIVTLKRGENIKYLPFAFTDCGFAKPSAKQGRGILMLANVLRSEQAIAVSTCLPAGRSTSSRSSPVCARCCFRTGISSRSWNNSRVASPATTRRSRPSSTTSRPWCRLSNNRVARSGSGLTKHEHRSS